MKERVDCSRVRDPIIAMATPERIVAELSVVAQLARDGAARDWAIERMRRGDPGPAFVEEGYVWTEASELDDARTELVSLMLLRENGRQP